MAKKAATTPKAPKKKFFTTTSLDGLDSVLDTQTIEDAVSEYNLEEDEHVYVLTLVSVMRQRRIVEAVPAEEWPSQL